jgi:hypothetical protein
MKGKRSLGKFSGEYAKHLRRYGKREFWRAYRRMTKVTVGKIQEVTK